MSGSATGGGGAAVRPRVQARGRRQHQAPSLPLDVLVEIAACSDPATLVRCAATCRDVRHRIAGDPAIRGRLRLRLRHTDRFVRPLLRGHLIERDRFSKGQELYLVEAAAAGATTLRRASDGFASECQGENMMPVTSRDGFILVRAGQELRVCNPATGRSQTLPPEPEFPYSTLVLLVDGGEGGRSAVGRPFQVLLARLELSQHRRHLQIQTFSSERGTWGRRTEIRIPNVHGNWLNGGILRCLGTALVIGDAVHWLCLTSSETYVLKLQVRSEHVTATALPENFPHGWQVNYLLATASASESPIVLTADSKRILAWSQSKQTAKWKAQP